MIKNYFSNLLGKVRIILHHMWLVILFFKIYNCIYMAHTISYSKNKLSMQCHQQIFIKIALENNKTRQ